MAADKSFASRCVRCDVVWGPSQGAASCFCPRVQVVARMLYSRDHASAPKPWSGPKRLCDTLVMYITAPKKPRIVSSTCALSSIVSQYLYIGRQEPVASMSRSTCFCVVAVLLCIVAVVSAAEPGELSMQHHRAPNSACTLTNGWSALEVFVAVAVR